MSAWRRITATEPPQGQWVLVHNVRLRHTHVLCRLKDRWISHHSLAGYGIAADPTGCPLGEFWMPEPAGPDLDEDQRRDRT